ncbi:MAG: hypothetical protein N2114_00800 [Candidatus Goldbacteria bacterium]|nr:hypothetical protein [Candidatus Goldiibacteriota bacterium]
MKKFIIIIIAMIIIIFSCAKNENPTGTGDQQPTQLPTSIQTSTTPSILTSTPTFIQTSTTPSIPTSTPTSLSSAIKFEKSFGGNSIDEGSSIQQTTDGGYIIAGFTNSFGASGYNGYLVKTDSFGNTIWSNTFGGNGSDQLNFVRQTVDSSGYIIIGSTDSYGVPGYKNIYLVRTNNNGTAIWTKAFGENKYNCYGKSVHQTSDDGYFIVGTKEYTGGFGYTTDVFLIKTDNIGTMTWSKTIGGSSIDNGFFGQQTKDGGYIVIGQTFSYGAGNSDIYLIKIDNSGNTVWSKTFGGTSVDVGYSIQQTKDEGYIIVGKTTSYGAGDYDVYLIKTDSSGNIQWSKTFGGTNADEGNSVQQTIDGGYIIAGYTTSYGAGDYDVYLIKTDSSGNIQWSKTFGGNSSDSGSWVQQTADGGYIITGSTKSFSANGDYDIYLIKTDSNGNVN